MATLAKILGGAYLKVFNLHPVHLCFAAVEQEPAESKNSAVLPAVLGSMVAVVVIGATVVLLYYFGRICRNRYYAGTW